VQYGRWVTPVPEIPDSLPLVLRPSRRGTIAAFAAGILFGVVGLVVAVSGGVLVAIFCLALAAVGLFGGVMGVMPKRSELRLDDQGLEVVSPVKRWKAAWGEIERFEQDTIPSGRFGSAPVVRVVYRDGFGARHEATSLAGKALGVDEHLVVPGYGNLTNEQLCELLSRFRKRFGD
jgi:hypothetical protein